MSFNFLVSYMINPLDLTQKHRQKQLNRIKIYDKFLQKCEKRMKYMASLDKYECFYEVPPFDLFQPVYDVKACALYILFRLKKNNFDVSLNPKYQNIIHISWAKHKKLFSSTNDLLTLPAPINIEEDSTQNFENKMLENSNDKIVIPYKKSKINQHQLKYQYLKINDELIDNVNLISQPQNDFNSSNIRLEDDKLVRDSPVIWRPSTKQKLPPPIYTSVRDSNHYDENVSSGCMLKSPKRQNNGSVPKENQIYSKCGAFSTLSSGTSLKSNKFFNEHSDINNEVYKIKPYNKIETPIKSSLNKLKSEKDDTISVHSHKTNNTVNTVEIDKELARLQSFINSSKKYT